jgi:hypothetical protein
VYVIADRELAGQELLGSSYATATNASGLATGKFAVIEEAPRSLVQL